MKSMNKIVGSLLLASALLLGVMIPGGPIETRDFSGISPIVLGMFNVFLTLLGILSFPVAFFAFKRKRAAYALAGLAGLGYFAVYVLDLLRIFPRSPVGMPTALFILEIAGAIVAVPLSVLGLRLRFFPGEQEGAGSGARIPAWGWAIIAVIGAAIVAFATVSAATPH